MRPQKLSLVFLRLKGRRLKLLIDEVIFAVGFGMHFTGIGWAFIVAWEYGMLVNASWRDISGETLLLLSRRSTEDVCPESNVD